MSTKRVHFGTHSAKSSSTRGGGVRSGTKTTKKAKAKKKPEWDTTVSDLTVHKLSKEEQEKRRLSFLSKNSEAAKHDLYEKAKGSFELDVSGNLRPSPSLSGMSRHSRNSSKLAALHQALHGKELHDVLAESDRALAVVRDLFGDDPKRYTCQPNVTVAPHIITDKGKLERTLLESQGDGPSPTVLASPGGIRDESVLELAPRKPALNELPSPTQDESEADATLTANDNSERADSADFIPHGRHYRPSIDLTRFQKLIESEEETDDPHRRDIPQCSNITRSHKSTEMQPRSGQREEQYDDNSSIDGMSELSSIPPESGRRENITVDSEASSVHAHPVENITKEPVHHPAPVHGRNVTSDRQPLAAGREGDVGEGEQGKKRHQTVTSLTQHPLHVAHRMAAPSVHQKSSQEPETERDSERGHQDKIHSQLHTLEKMVEKLESELAAYEEANNLTTVSLSDITNTTPPPSLISQLQSPTPSHGHHRPRSGSGSLGSITKSLLSSMTKMMSYLRQSEVQLKGEVAVRVQMLQTMTEQQNLMDTLTADLIKLRSENVSLRQELGELKKTSSEQIRKIQDDFADVHKKLSSLAVSHAHQAPPLSYLQPPHLPLLPPHLLQTPPTSSSSHAHSQASTNTTSQSEHHNQHTVLSEHFKSPTYPHSNVTPSSTHATAHNIPPVTTGGISATKSTLAASSTPHNISVPGEVVSRATPYVTQHKPLEHGGHGVDSSELTGRSDGNLGTKHTASHLTSVHSKSTPVTKLSNDTAPLRSASSLAPPPLSEALRVPGFDAPPFVSHHHHQSSGSTSTSVATAPSMANTLASRPAFDVEAFINSLRKNQPQLGTTSATLSGGHSSSVAMPASKAGAGVPISLSQPHPPSQTLQTAKLHPSLKERAVPMADLSVSLVSSGPEDDENDRRDYSEATTETSEQTDTSEQKTNTTIHPPELQRDLPPGYVHGQGLTDHKLKPGWFALTSHLSQS